MAAVTTPTQLDGLFKMVYGESIENLIPESSILTKMIDFVPADRETGNKYNQPVVLSQEHGVTYAASSAGAFALNSAVAMTMGNAQLEGSQILLRSSLSYDAAAKASNSKKAFATATGVLVENMMESITKRAELSLLYGQATTGIGNPSSAAGGTSTTAVVTITTASWAAGIWAGTENAEVDILDAGVKVNTNAALVVTSVDLDARTILVTGNSTDITAIKAITYTTADAIVFRGALNNEMAGLDKIITNTGSLFGINAGTYNLWKGNSYSVGSGDLTFGKVVLGLSSAVSRGLKGRVALICNPVTWENLNDDLAALRHYDQSYKPKDLEIGGEVIKYHYQGGIIEIYSHIFVKQGEAFAFPINKLVRLGAQDISFKTPGKGGEMFRELSDNAGYELRVYTDQALLARCPAQCVKYTNIVNSF